MVNLGEIYTGLATVLAGIGAAIVTVRAAKRAELKQAQTEVSGSQIVGQTEFVKSLMARVASVEAQLAAMSHSLDTQRGHYERQAREDARKFEAREDQLVRWGMWEASPPPRQPPEFLWPPVVVA